MYRDDFFRWTGVPLLMFYLIHCWLRFYYKASKELNKFFKKYKINLVVDQKYFPISKNKVSKLNVIFSTAFGRQLEYYTGMVFKIDIKSKSKIVNCCNGGRYDKLISDLGSKKQTPAVGAALNLNY